jgi:hypothetical protein|tara:strand:+ start:303 stop:473 length:171 start_codon:yes stop_codon:yes gene_type:complete
MNNYSFKESITLVNDLEGLLNGFKIPVITKISGGRKTKRKSRRKTKRKSRRKSRYK